MNYVVVWDPDATRDIDTAWEKTTDAEREHLTAALAVIQQKFRRTLSKLASRESILSNASSSRFL